jgi:hypothetical protein
MIKTRKETVIEVRDWNGLVESTYGRLYNFQQQPQQDDCKERQRVYITIPDKPCDYENDTVPEIVNDTEMGVSFKAWLERDPKQPLEGQEYDFELSMYWVRSFYPDVQMVANDLYEKGLIEAGKYVIDLDW